MSNEEDKSKHSKRLQRAWRAITRQLKIAKQHHIVGYRSQDEKEPHRMAKRHAMDCGNPHCYLCGNPRKTHKDRLTAQEKRLFQDVEKQTDKHSNGLINDAE